MLECCLSGRAQSDLVLASILRVVMAVMASPPTTGAGDSGPASRQERKSLHLSSLNWTTRLGRTGQGGGKLLNL